MFRTTAITIFIHIFHLRFYSIPSNPERLFDRVCVCVCVPWTEGGGGGGDGEGGAVLIGWWCSPGSTRPPVCPPGVADGRSDPGVVSGVQALVWRRLPRPHPPGLRPRPDPTRSQRYNIRYGLYCWNTRLGPRAGFPLVTGLLTFI